VRKLLLPAAVAFGAVMHAAAQAPAPPSRPRITGIAHVAFRVSDTAAAREFYGGMLGLTEAPAKKGPGITFAVGTRQRVVLEPGLPPGEDERLRHLAFETPDVPALTTYLTGRGLAVQRSDDCQPGAIRLMDPDGHTIEFVQVAWPPAAPASPRQSAALAGRLLHAGLVIRDEARAHGFYRDSLGFVEIWRGGRPAGATNWVNMRVPDGTDYLEYMLAAAPPDRRQLGVLHHLCLRVPEMQEAWEEVARRSVSMKRALPSPPQVGVNGRYQLNLFDPDGTRTELMEPYTVR
jgi:lactoylglutathione lyase